MLSVFQSIPQPLWLIESNLMQASLLTPLSWILLLGHERKEQTWSSFLWAWRSEWCLFSMAISTERLCHWRFKCPFAIHRLLRRLSIPYTRLPLEKYVFPRTRTESTNDPYRANLYLFFNPHVFGNFRHSTFHVSNRQHIKKAALRDFGAVSAEVLCEVSINSSRFSLLTRRY